eukprot:15446246-Alexandrium_andersonii.AAC.2
MAEHDYLFHLRPHVVELLAQPLASRAADLAATELTDHHGLLRGIILGSLRAEQQQDSERLATGAVKRHLAVAGARRLQHCNHLNVAQCLAAKAAPFQLVGNLLTFPYTPLQTASSDH